MPENCRQLEPEAAGGTASTIKVTYTCAQLTLSFCIVLPLSPGNNSTRLLFVSYILWSCLVNCFCNSCFTLLLRYFQFLFLAWLSCCWGSFSSWCKRVVILGIWGATFWDTESLLISLEQGVTLFRRQGLVEIKDQFITLCSLDYTMEIRAARQAHLRLHHSPLCFCACTEVPLSL